MPHYEIKHLLPVFSRVRRAVAVAVLVGVAVAPAWRRNAQKYPSKLIIRKEHVWLNSIGSF